MSFAAVCMIVACLLLKAMPPRFLSLFKEEVKG